MTHIFNKYVCNAIEVSIDGYIENLIDLRTEFEKPTDINYIQHIGFKNLNRIKDWLKFDIENTQECLNDSYDDEEIDMLQSYETQYICIHFQNELENGNINFYFGFDPFL